MPPSGPMAALSAASASTTRRALRWSGSTSRSTIWGLVRLWRMRSMKCPKCQHFNDLAARFCEECAAPLAKTCAKCGHQLSPTAKFCPECAQPTGVSTGAASSSGAPETYTPRHLASKILNSRAAIEGERKQVTVLFADLKGSMELL